MFLDLIPDAHNLVDIGGKEWYKSNPYGIDFHRIYFNDLEFFYNLKSINSEYYLDNYRIPFDIGQNLRIKLRQNKLWFDVKSNKFNSDLPKEIELEIIKNIQIELANLTIR